MGRVAPGCAGARLGTAPASTQPGQLELEQFIFIFGIFGLAAIAVSRSQRSCNEELGLSHEARKGNSHGRLFQSLLLLQGASNEALRG